MKELLNWALARRYAIIALAVIFAPNLSFLSAAIMALHMAYRGPVMAISDGLIALLVVTLIAYVAGGASAMALAGGIAIAFGLLVGAAIRTFRSLTLTIQAMILCGYGLILLYSIFGSTSYAVFDVMMEQFVELLRAQGATEGRILEVQARQGRLIGIFAISIFFDVITIMFLAYWWLSLVRPDIEFGAQFRAFRLGYVLSTIGAIIVVSVVVVSALAIDWALVHNLFAIAACGFLLQALAYSHNWAHSEQRHALYLVPIYLLLFLTFFVFVMAGIFGWTNPA